MVMNWRYQNDTGRRLNYAAMVLVVIAGCGSSTDNPPLNPTATLPQGQTEPSKPNVVDPNKIIFEGASSGYRGEEDIQP
jgi:hypothetical protein